MDPDPTGGFTAWVNSQIQASSMTNALTQILGDMRNLSAEASGATATLASNVSGLAGESAQTQAAVQSAAQNMQTAASEGQMRDNQLYALMFDSFSQTRDIATAAMRESQRVAQQILDSNRSHEEDRRKMYAAFEAIQKQLALLRADPAPAVRQEVQQLRADSASALQQAAQQSSAHAAQLSQATADIDALRIAAATSPPATQPNPPAARASARPSAPRRNNPPPAGAVTTDSEADDGPIDIEEIANEGADNEEADNEEASPRLQRRGQQVRFETRHSRDSDSDADNSDHRAPQRFSHLRPKNWENWVGVGRRRSGHDAPLERRLSGGDG
ncbi:hypothetical protein NESM_000936000 [Novymonas esmeraldas]|uniref:Uncharacterized protein n=1 Tax=Novymonas esmeraldas TaxID=1808958 RepID=A0AAW0F0I3_9TRYP